MYLAYTTKECNRNEQNIDKLTHIQCLLLETINEDENDWYHCVKNKPPILPSLAFWWEKPEHPISFLGQLQKLTPYKPL